MAWVIMLLIWVAVTALVGYPYVEKIQKVRDERKKVFSYFVVAVAGWSILIAKLAEKVLGMILEDKNKEEELW